MNNAEKSDFEAFRDTSPLAPERLSERERDYILEIEKRLIEAKDIPYKGQSSTTSGSKEQFSEAPFANVQERYRRVLLLDGGRGTGKTSILLTLVKRWHAHMAMGERPKNDHKQVAGLGEPPTHIRVVRVLDFDPLPLGMPILAGIIQALRPLAEAYDPQFADDDHDEYQKRLLDRWRSLFRVAALGWSAIPNRSGLIEQVLDREEQVQDWQQIADEWQSFVGNVLHRGERFPGASKLPEDAVLVIMIDDVDLQVERVQELLPALRTLYHPRVFFLVAADSLHMIDMLKLDFFGRQNQLARRRTAKSEANTDRWASDLAYSAFQKVFPRRNQWKLESLTCLEFLAFPGQVVELPLSDRRSVSKSKTQNKEAGNFLSELDQIVRQKETPEPAGPKGAGKLILQFGREADKVRLPGVMPYRGAEQLRQYVTGRKKPFEVLARLLSQDADDRPAVIQQDGLGVNVSVTGELAALYQPGLIEPSGMYNVVLSDRPDFVFLGPLDRSARRMSAEPGNRFNFTGALIAKMLEEAHFPVNAAGLRWETYLSLAWTEWRFLGLSFAWTRHTHPRPDELLNQLNPGLNLSRAVSSPRASWSDLPMPGFTTSENSARINGIEPMMHWTQHDFPLVINCRGSDCLTSRRRQLTNPTPGCAARSPCLHGRNLAFRRRFRSDCSATCQLRLSKSYTRSDDGWLPMHSWRPGCNGAKSFRLLLIRK